MSLITQPMLAPPELPAGGIQFPVLASPKLDGIRCLRIDGRTLSRKFLEIPNQHIQEVMRSIPVYLGELDGELIVEGWAFNQISSAVMSEDGKPDFRYYVFDVVSTTLNEEYVSRMARLKKLTLPSFCVKVLPQLIKSQKELDAYEQECVDKGYEGVMVRSISGPYKCGRSTAKQGWLLKVKRWEDSEAEIIGFVEKTHNENEATVDELGHTKRSKAATGLVPAGTLGKFLVREVGSTPWKGKEFGIGTGIGLGDDLRQEIWDNRAKYLGKIVTYKYQPHGVVDLPRLPVWKGFRSPLDMSK